MTRVPRGQEEEDRQRHFENYRLEHLGHAAHAEPFVRERKARLLEELINRHWSEMLRAPEARAADRPPAKGSPFGSVQAPVRSKDVLSAVDVYADGVTVRDVTGYDEHPLIYVETGARLDAAARHLADHGIGLVLVVNPEGALDGVLSERDIVRAVGTGGSGVLAGAVDPFVTEHVVTCRSGDALADVVKVMTDHHIRHMPIVDDGVLRGMISATDIVTYLAGAPN